MGKTHVRRRRRRKPQAAAAAHASLSVLRFSLVLFARAQHHFDKPHRSIAFNPTLCAPSGMSMLETTHSQFSSESKKNRTEKWSGMAPHGKPTLLHIGRPVQAQNHCSFYAICSQLTFLGQPVSLEGEERRQAAIATSYCPLSSSSLPRL